MTTRKNTLAAALGLVVCSGALADSTNLGPVGNWDGGGGEVAIMGMDGPEPVGSISGDGLVTVVLPASGEEGRSFASAFGCDSDGAVIINPAEATFTPSGLAVVDMAAQEFIGELLAFSSAEYGTAWLQAMGSGSSPDVPGATYRLVYVSEPVTVTGRCENDFWVDGGASSAVKQVTEYAMDFPAGWNLLKTDTRTSVTSNLGVTFPLDIRMESAALAAAEVYWHLDAY